MKVLEKRIYACEDDKNVGDPLLDLTRYKVLLLIPEYSGKLYWMVERLYEAVTHKWPDINSIPEAIATNRVLNNNIFSPTNK